MSVAYDGLGNSPWDAIWYDGEDEDLDVLDCEMRVGPVWRPPLVRVERRERRPAIYGFQLRFAMAEAACKQLSSLLGDTVEFLRLRVKRKTPLFVMHRCCVSIWMRKLWSVAIASVETSPSSIGIASLK